MKINYNSPEATGNTEPKQSEPIQINELSSLFNELQQKYGEVNFISIDDKLFFYRHLKRGEYLELSKNQKLTELEKEGIVCEVCTVHPDNFDFDDCEAALPSILCKAILKASYLDSVETRTALLSFFREEMYDLQNQMTCVINEAFPQFSLEEIEDWDMIKTAKYLSRAEWKLVNLRGASFNFDPNQTEAEPAQQEYQNPQPKEDENKNLKGGKKEKITPDKLAELQRMKQMFPEIDWDGDAGLSGIEGINGAELINDVVPALREGF